MPNKPPKTFDKKLSELNYDKTSTDDEKEQIDIQINAHIQEIQKQMSILLEKHGVAKYQLSFIHEGTNQIILESKGSLLEVAELSHRTTRSLQEQIKKRIGIIDT